MRIHADAKHCKRDTMKYEKIKKIVCRSRDSRVRLRYGPYLNNNEIISIRQRFLVFRGKVKLVTRLDAAMF
jgi:hypothetical protein